MSESSPYSPSNMPNEQQRRGALVLRTLPILLLPGLPFFISFGIFALTSGLPWADQSPPDGRPFGPLLLLVVLVIFTSALIMLVRLGRPTLSALLLIGTWTLLTTLVSLQTGATSYFPALLIVPICAAGLLIDRVASVSLAALATLLVASFAWIEQSGYLPPNDAPLAVARFLKANAPYLALGFWSGLFWSVAALTSLLAGGLHTALSRSRAQAQELSVLSAQLEERITVQTAQLLDQEREAVTLEERTRLAREIHDTLAQGLTGVVVQLGAAQRALKAAPTEMDQHLDLAQRMARETLAEARRSVWNLRTPALDHGDLADALRGLVARPLDAKLTISFEQQGTAWPLPPAVEGALLRVCQEALANVAKHAQATLVVMSLEYRTEVVQLCIRDNGIGFSADVLHAETPPHLGGGFGLLGMRERIRNLGGMLELRNVDGAQVIAVVPRGDDEPRSTLAISMDAMQTSEPAGRTA